MFKKVDILLPSGISGLLFAVYLRIRRLLRVRAKSFHNFESLLRQKNGLEIGGHSQVFTGKGIFPVYPIAGQLDNCNFSGTTVWEDNIKEGQTFRFDKKKPPGRQYIAEATNLESIPSEDYDFVLSSHVLEHMANPVLALKEWVRILKSRGLLVMLLPHKDGTFDHHRPVTTMQHLISDFESGMAEDDLTHLPEILDLHDLKRDPLAGDFAAFKARSLKNFENRCLHHHVFDTRLAIGLIDYINLKILTVEAILPFHILIVAQKPETGEKINNSAFLGEMQHILRKSPFQSDRL